jgi:hypothetical protein
MAKSVPLNRMGVEIGAASIGFQVARDRLW